MASIEHLLADIDPVTIAQKVGIAHDRARGQFSLPKITVSTEDEFLAIIADYYNHHFTTCVTQGGALPRSEAVSRAEALIERAYQRRGGNLATAYQDAQHGTNGGLRVILDVVAEGLKAESVEHYVRDAFRRHVGMSSWTDKVDIMRQFLKILGRSLPSNIRTDEPERYARDYEELIRGYVSSMDQLTLILRRY